MVGHAVHASGDQYLAPVFKFDEEEHAAVLQEAATMDRVLSGQQARPSTNSTAAAPSPSLDAMLCGEVPGSKQKRQ